MMTDTEIMNWIQTHSATLVYTGKRWRAGILIEIDSSTFHHIEAFGSTPAEVVEKMEQKRAEMVRLVL